MVTSASKPSLLYSHRKAARWSVLLVLAVLSSMAIWSAYFSLRHPIIRTPEWLSNAQASRLCGFPSGHSDRGNTSVCIGAACLMARSQSGSTSHPNGRRRSGERLLQVLYLMLVVKVKGKDLWFAVVGTGDEDHYRQCKRKYAPSATRSASKRSGKLGRSGREGYCPPRKSPLEFPFRFPLCW